MQSERSLNSPTCSPHSSTERRLVTTGTRRRMLAQRLTGARVTARYRESRRKLLRRPDTRRRHRVPGGPKGLDLVTSSRGRDSSSWRRHRYRVTDHGGSAGARRGT